MCAALAFVGCDEDEVAKKYQVTVNVSCETASIADMSNLAATAVGDNGSEIAGTVQDSTITFNLAAGAYNVTVTAQDDFYNYAGSAKITVADKDLDGITITLGQSKPAGTIIFKEIYTTGVQDYYWTDGFYELVNNSDEIQYLDGIIMGIVTNGYGDVSSWADSLGNLPDYYPMTNSTVYFPGTGTDYPLMPGQSVVCATRPLNHAARELTEADTQSPVDLSTADWDIYIPQSAQDTDVPNIPNMLVAYRTFGFDFMPATAGQSLILAKLPAGQTVEDFVADPENIKKPAYSAALCIPSDYVIDAVEILYYNKDLAINKVILDKDDAGYTYYSGSEGEWTDPTYTGRSLRRKCTKVENGRAYFADTNNSSNDFILGGQTAVVRRQFTEAD